MGIRKGAAWKICEIKLRFVSNVQIYNIMIAVMISFTCYAL